MKRNNQDSNNINNISNKWKEQGFGSNPQKSWEGGKKGMTPVPEAGTQASSTLNSSGNSGSSTSLGNASRVNTKPDAQRNQGWQSTSATGKDSGRKEGESPTGKAGKVQHASDKGANDLTANQPQKQSWHSVGGSAKSNPKRGENAAPTNSRSNAKSQSRTGNK